MMQDERRSTRIGLAMADGLTVVLWWAAGCSYLFRQDLYRLVVDGPPWLVASIGGIGGVWPVLNALVWVLMGLGCAGLMHSLVWRLGLRALPRATTADPSRRSANIDGAWTRGLLLVTVAAGIALRLVQMGTALEYDELVTVHHFVNAPSLWDAISRQVVFNNHPAYTVLARLTTGMLGTSEVAVRLPAFVLGCLTMPAVWWAARAALPTVGALAATAVVAFHPMHVHYSQNARGYTGVALCSVIALALFDRALRTGSRLFAAGFVVAAVAAAWFHLYGVWLLLVGAPYVVGLVLWSALGRGRPVNGLAGEGFRAIWPALAIAGIGVLAVYGPMWPSLFWSVVGRGRGVLDEGFAPQVLLGMLGSSVWGATAALAAGLLVLGAVRGRRLRPVLLVALLAAPLATVSVVHPADVGLRFFSYWVPCLALLLGSGVAQGVTRRTTGLRVAVTAAVISALLIVLGSWTRVVLGSQRSGKTRDAAHYALSLSPAGRVCTVGDAEILSVYLRDRLVRVESIRDLEGSPIPSCIVWDVAWLSPTDRGILGYLERSGRRRDFEDLAVFDLVR
jgi:hypothetical protein